MLLFTYQKNPLMTSFLILIHILKNLMKLELQKQLQHIKEKFFNSERAAMMMQLIDDVILYFFDFLFTYKIYPFKLLATA